MYTSDNENKTKPDCEKEEPSQQTQIIKGDIDDFIFAHQPYRGPSER